MFKLNRKALAAVTFAAALTAISSVAFAKDKAPSDDGVWFGGAEEFYEDFTPKAIERNEKEQIKAKEKAQKDAVKAKARREKAAKEAAERDRKAEKRRAANEAKDARRAEKAQKKTAANDRPVKVKETAKRKKGDPGALQPSDFTYKGLALGDDTEKMRKCLGEPDFDQLYSIHGIQVRYFIYGRKLRVGVFEPIGAPPRVVDIVIRDDGYKARNGVRYGSTPYHVFETYGKAQRQPIDERLYYVFEDEGPGHKRLLLEYQAPENIVISWRITSLPLSDAEADRRYDEFLNAAVATDVGALMIRQKTIDTSEIDISGGTPQINIAID